MCDSRIARSSAEDLVVDYGVKYIIGGFCSDETLGAVEVTEINKVILFSPTSTSLEISTAGDFVFRTVQSDKPGAISLAEELFNDGYRKLAIFIELTEFTFSIRKIFVEKFVELGGEIVISNSFDEFSQNQDKFINQLKNSSADSLLIIPQGEEIFNNVLSKLKSENIYLPIYTNGNIVIPGARVGLEDYLNGTKFFTQQVSKESESSKELIDKLKTKIKTDFTNKIEFFYITAAYDLVCILTDSIKICDDVFDTECVKDNLYKVENYLGYSGNISFNEFGDPEYISSIIEFRDGEFIKIN